MRRRHAENPAGAGGAAGARGASRRGFTLLETVLAAVLGLLVIVAALSLFTVVQRSDKRSQAKMEENLELASAHTMIARAFHFLLMSDQARPKESETNDFLKGDDERNSPELAEVQDDDAASKRFYLQPATDNLFMMTVGTEDQPRRACSQVFGLTLRDSPIPGGGDKTPEQAYIDQVVHERVMMRAAERLNERIGGGSSRDSGNANAPMSESRSAGDWGDRGGRNGSRDRRLSLRDRSGRESAGSSERRGEKSGLGSDGPSGIGDADSDGQDERTASERLEDAEEERPRAPGVRGVFEILPDGVDPSGELSGEGVSTARLEEGDGSRTYSLWWRELPPLEINNDEAGPGADGEGVGADGGSDGEAAAGEGAKSREADGALRSGGKRGLRGSDDSARSDRTRESRGSDRALGGGVSGGAGDAIDREVQRLVDSSDTTGKRVRLLSGLKTCHWTAFRGRKERDKIWAEFDVYLPAFVELEIVTASGRRENWVFDVAWTLGPEPGSLVAQAPDALNPGVGGVAGVGDDPTGQPGDPTGGGAGDPKGDGKGGAGPGKPNKGGKKGEPTQQDINKIIDDAIRRATQQGGGGGKQGK